MHISGFTFIRNAIKYDYPVAEAIRSILPLCDEVVVAVGDSDDGTRDLIESIDSTSVRILDTRWDESLHEGGEVLAKETNKALNAISPNSDWAFYIQADEIVHEQNIDTIRKGMEQWREDPRVEGLLFNYLHFWGSYDWTGNSRKWYRREIRIIKPGIGIHSYKDAQGFRKEGKKIRVKPLDAWIYHYGWVKPPSTQQAKQREFHKYWHDNAWIRKHVSEKDDYDYSVINTLARFTGDHPPIMHPRIHKKNWDFEPQTGVKSQSLRHQFLDIIETKTGIRIGEYKNYIIV